MHMLVKCMLSEFNWIISLLNCCQWNVLPGFNSNATLPRPLLAICFLPLLINGGVSYPPPLISRRAHMVLFAYPEQAGLSFLLNPFKDHWHWPWPSGTTEHSIRVWPWLTKSVSVVAQRPMLRPNAKKKKKVRLTPSLSWESELRTWRECSRVEWAGWREAEEMAVSHVQAEGEESRERNGARSEGARQ